MLNINLFGGPGVAKSTLAAGLFYKLKMFDLNVEYVTEYAKDLTYSGDFTRLSDQLLILGEQHHRIHRLEGKVDYLIHDSPFIMGYVYLGKQDHIPKRAYKKLILKMFKSYQNLNFFIERGTEYQQDGRNQTLEEAKEKDVLIKEFLDQNRIPYSVIKLSNVTLDELLHLILQEIQ